MTRKVARTARVVIGAGFGDEGKGLLTDAFAAETPSDTLVVRFNGGAQAGHTVTLGDGRRHVFSHFGSGTLAGAATFLSRFFVVHPLLYGRERETLRSLGVLPRVTVDPAAMVTTPWDMLVNQLVEEARGAARHGSVGIGFGETIERHIRSPLRTTVADLADPATLADRLVAIRREWMPARLADLGCADLARTCRGLIESDALLEDFLAAASAFRADVEVCPADHLPRTVRLVFEGAQGLLLDQDLGRTLGWFPHLTRSNTGLPNVAALAPDLGVTDLEVTYATRAYTTRHGAGPLPHALPGGPYPDIVDATNIPNPWQGSLRFGWLDLDLLGRVVAMDLSRISGAGLGVSHSVAVTCLDQVGAWPTIVRRRRRQQMAPESLLRAAAAATGADFALAGLGPTRSTLSAPQTAAGIGRMWAA